ncbi:glucosaminidase domain-containing protein [Clostridium sp. YIM B02515]|uniref:Glucosaminidase domain-containing protein n=1 Tax=Clostridium rhizosphaerae TaxID=2803861 RepID=A0ABS1T6N6_9CLOT|nr:glucosaminidase domain-containing protein [Clostridium rhizosphaerae]MBL4935011.1 glucosaminidase domain-containing protein [Clostridium rhizosphaerae]
MDRKEFINSVKEGALKGYADYRILPSLTIAQAILESSWGSSQLSVRARNLFGIKAFSNWRGDKITLPTTEWYGDKKQVINSDFRAYDSFNESIEDHSKLLSSVRYTPVRECSNYKEACRKIYECGYATDPAYPEKLVRIIEENKLYDFDNSEVLPEVSVATKEDKTLKFQRLCNSLGIRDYEGKALAEDNKLGPRTRSCIGKMLVLKEGSKGEAVRFVQEIVKAVPVDGSFGPITKKCVMEYQRAKNIEVDGIVGTQTWTTIVTT